jgi:hypothetical protein
VALTGGGSLRWLQGKHRPAVILIIQGIRFGGVEMAPLSHNR